MDGPIEQTVVLGELSVLAIGLVSGTCFFHGLPFCDPVATSGCVAAPPSTRLLATASLRHTSDEHVLSQQVTHGWCETNDALYIDMRLVEGRYFVVYGVVPLKQINRSFALPK